MHRKTEFVHDKPVCTGLWRNLGEMSGIINFSMSRNAMHYDSHYKIVMNTSTLFGCQSLNDFISHSI